jgi:hypothetical protein
MEAYWETVRTQAGRQGGARCCSPACVGLASVLRACRQVIPRTFVPLNSSAAPDVSQHGTDMASSVMLLLLSLSLFTGKAPTN